MCDIDSWEGEGGFCLTTALDDGIIDDDDAAQAVSGVTNPTE